MGEIFGVCRIEGEKARYQQTPMEFFPFGSSGVDGVHYGFIIHTADQEDYPSGEICPMDDDGVILLGNNSKEIFQNLMYEVEIFKMFPQLLSELELDKVITRNQRYNELGQGLRVAIKPRKNWTFINTSDGVGVFAETDFFMHSHITKYDNQNSSIEYFQDLAFEMQTLGLYASQLYYLKELYWNEWTDDKLAKELLTQMLEPYEKLNRQHLYDTTIKAIKNFDKRFDEQN